MRVSEVVRLRYPDIDFYRGVISVCQGKGRTDRSVTLPNSYRPLLKHLGERAVDLVSRDAREWPGSTHYPVPYGPRLNKVTKTAAIFAAFSEHSDTSIWKSRRFTCTSLVLAKACCRVR